MTEKIPFKKVSILFKIILLLLLYSREKKRRVQKIAMDLRVNLNFNTLNNANNNHSKDKISKDLSTNHKKTLIQITFQKLFSLRINIPIDLPSISNLKISLQFKKSLIS